MTYDIANTSKQWLHGCRQEPRAVCIRSSGSGAHVHCAKQDSACRDGDRADGVYERERQRVRRVYEGDAGMLSHMPQCALHGLVVRLHRRLRLMIQVLLHHACRHVSLCRQLLSEQLR